MKKSVLFDLDGTLLDRDESVKQFIAAQYNRLGGIAQNSVFVGDNPEADIMRAKNANLRTI